MGANIGIVKPDLQSLARIGDRLTFVYLEKCKINRENAAITVRDQEGVTYIPAAMVSVLLLGPGTDISHRAIELIGDAGLTIIWVGEHGIKYYASGRSLTNHSRLLLKQAEYVTHEKKHIAVARKMYQLRFPNEDTSRLTMQQLRGREGSRIRKIYRELSKKWNVAWSGRDYKPGDYEKSDLVNQALSAGNACLYGLAYAVIVSLGCSPGLGFVHVGHELSFVYDIADLYKAETTIPIAFEIAATEKEDIASLTRRRLRDEFKNGHILQRMVKDIKFLLSEEEFVEDFESPLYLWDNFEGLKEYGVLYQESIN